MKTYSDFLREELDNFSGDFELFVLYVPDFFDVLCKILEEDISKEEKRIINSALAYFVLPNDVIPDDLYGPFGYVDDTYVCTLAIKKVIEKQGIGIAEKYWSNSDDFKEALEISYNKSLKILEEKGITQQVLEMSTLD